VHPPATARSPSRAEADEHPGAGMGAAADADPRPRRRRRLGDIAALSGLLALVVLPLVVGLLVMADDHWFPILDLAMTELQIRDVASSTPPLVGLAGRIGTATRPGNHPGPMSFWLLWGPYQLLGASAAAMQAATVVVHGVAMGATLWLARRRGGLVLAVAVALLLAVLVRQYGAEALTQPWNPYLPLLSWVLFLLAVWSVVCGDLKLLWVAVAAGSLCAQTHVPYLGMTAGLLALAVAVALFDTWRQRADPAARRALLRWGAVAAAVGALLWLPPVIDELVHDPGNLSILWGHFTDPPEEPVGLRRGVELLLLHLDAGHLLRGSEVAVGFQVGGVAGNGSRVVGTVLLGAWAVAALVSLRTGPPSLRRLHLVVGAALVLSAVSMGRIFGTVWYYLMLWAWAVDALLLIAVGWTVVAVVGPRLPTAARRPAAVASSLAMVAAVVGFAAVAADGSRHVEVPAPGLSATLRRIVPQTAQALRSGSVPGGGEDGRYLVRWSDPVDIGAPGFGLLNELERRGFDVGSLEAYRAAISPHRVRTEEESTAVVQLATGATVEEWDDEPGFVEVARVDLRSPAQRAEYERLRRRAIEELEQEGLVDLAAAVDGNLFGTAVSPDLPDRVQDDLTRMLELGSPTAVFVGPPR
jgi:hypothetical protein